MIRLLLETATEVCSVAVARGTDVLAEHTSAEAYRHSSHLTIFIQRVLGQAGLTSAQLEEVVLSDGPGSYTSLRVGAATAKGLCLALPGLRLRTVSSLTALSLAAEGEGAVLATLNSRKGEVFAQFFPSDFGALPPVQGGGGEEQRQLTVPHNARLTLDDWYQPYLDEAGFGANIRVVGPGQQMVRDYLADKLGNFTFTGPEHCSASLLLAPAAAPDERWSRLEDLATYEPFYLNPPFVTKSKKKPLG